MPLRYLNEQQKLACLAPKGYNLIIASAGTGKTSTIVGRIGTLLTQGNKPNEILLLTFTNKAAQEMLHRLSAKFPPDIIGQIEAGTFHAVAYRYLKQKTQFSLKQPKELKILLKSLYDRFFFSSAQAKPYSSHYLYEVFGRYQNTGAKEDFKDWLLAYNQDQSPHIQTYATILDEFSKLKKQYHYLDYNDLLLDYRQAILDQERTYQEVLVDEYQDTNPLQDSILQALNPPSLFCVGDYDQSIYAFNGADISIIANFQDRYPKSQIFTLTKNYRSSEAILSLANKVINHNPRIYPKTLEVIKNGNFSPPRLLIYEELFLQYQGIANAIKLSNCPFEEVAVIFRNNASADGIEASLREWGIPSKRKGGLSFFDSKEILFLLNLCSLFHNPKDMMAFIHVLSHAKGIGNAIAKDIYEALLFLGNQNPIHGLITPNPSIQNPYQANHHIQLGLFEDERALFDHLPKDFKNHPILSHHKLAKEGAEFLNALFCLCKQKSQNPKKLLIQIIQSPLFESIAQKFALERSITKEGNFSQSKKTQALERIYGRAKLLCDLANHYKELGRFLHAMVLGANEMNEGEGVNLLSIHASKGLEFKEVYLVDLMEGRFPNSKLIAKGSSLEEERRLFYVATTRAKEKLFLSYAKADKLKDIQYQASIFLYEAGLLQH